MYLLFGSINIWPTRDEIDKTMSEDFKAKYPKTRVIRERTEPEFQMPIKKAGLSAHIRITVQSKVWGQLLS